MNRNTWIAAVICFGIWFGYMRWFAPVAPPKTPDTATTTTTQGAGTTDTAAPASGTASNSTAPPTAVPAVATPVAPDLFVSNEGGRFGFSAKRAELSLVEVLRYREKPTGDAPALAAVLPALTVPAASVSFSDKRLADAWAGDFTASQQGRRVSFVRESGGFRFERDFTVPDKGFWIPTALRVVVPKDGGDWGYVNFAAGGRALTHKAEDPLQTWEAVGSKDDSIERENLEGFTGEKLLQGVIAWAAFGNRYFTTVLVNKSALNPDLQFRKDAQFQGLALRYPIRPKDAKGVDFSFDLYAGPKDYDAFVGVPGLKKVIDYGFFSWFAFLLLEGLRFFYKFVGNWGVAIILLTILVRALFFPLSIVSYRSMKGMQRLQPQIASLREKYKNDPQRMNQEQLALFKANKVNPAAGCLPLLVQLPVFFALYSVFGHSIELFQTPFFGWIHDLSVKDPFYVLPVLMGVAMFFQQKITPTSGMDPAQAKILLLMPIVFTFVMLSLPSGLTLYIFVSTLLGIVQQLYFNRETAKSTPPGPLVAAPGRGGP